MTERYNLRIRDLLTGKTLVTARRGRTLIAYWERNFEKGESDWLWQYESRFGWAEIPVRTRKSWYEKYLESKEKSNGNRKR